MGYFNPISQYGIENFFLDSSKFGVDGLIVVDLPPEGEPLDFKSFKKIWYRHNKITYSNYNFR